jgi:hypothetical protein
MLLGVSGRIGFGKDAAIPGDAIEVSLVPEKNPVMVGEPVYLSFVVKNKTKRDLQVIIGGDYQNLLGRPSSFTVQVTDEAGRAVPQPDAGQDLGGISGPQRIPSAGTYSFRLFLPHWATIDRPGHYTIVAKRTLKLSEVALDPADWDRVGTSIPKEATAKLEVIPTDQAALGKIIDALGRTLVANAHRTAADELSVALRAMHDERVIPWLVKALRSDDYSLKFAALEGLSKFNDERALAGLREGLRTTARDFDHTTTNAELYDQLAENIRYAAAIGLSKSPHPAALGLLLEQSSTGSFAVKNLVLQVLGTRMPKEQAIPQLRKMTTDSDPTIRDGAKRYLQMLGDQP